MLQAICCATVSGTSERMCRRAHNIKTLDGLGTFHGVGIISATVVPPGNFGGQWKTCTSTRQATESVQCNQEYLCTYFVTRVFFIARNSQREAQCNSVIEASTGTALHN